MGKDFRSTHLTVSKVLLRPRRRASQTARAKAVELPRSALQTLERFLPLPGYHEVAEKLSSNSGNICPYGVIRRSAGTAVQRDPMGTPGLHFDIMILIL
ncbi:hypothetical protein AcW1_004363 [Taiwanofungus camphoratus]|nr:hypothetical protein AcV5_000741 [Antrodia cinnamomea]KAI0952199.1 hypothetical protein AcV7_008080 [Antrodia cinnamomea]KAI0959571.1 hypothetical protein AcW1_004363 [Antrodia cinnamomea]